MSRTKPSILSAVSNMNIWEIIQDRKKEDISLEDDLLLAPDMITALAGTYTKRLKKYGCDGIVTVTETSAKKNGTVAGVIQLLLSKLQLPKNS